MMKTERSKHIQITIDHIQSGQFVSQKAFDDWEFRVKAFEVALRINPDLLDGFDEEEGPFYMY